MSNVSAAGSSNIANATDVCDRLNLGSIAQRVVVLEDIHSKLSLSVRAATARLNDPNDRLPEALPSQVGGGCVGSPQRTPDGRVDWWLLQAHRDVAAQIMRLAEQLQVADADRWATGVLAIAERGGAADGAQLLRAAHMAALGRQLEPPTQPPTQLPTKAPTQAATQAAALSVQEIRQLASAQAQMQSSATAQEGHMPSGQLDIEPRHGNTHLKSGSPTPADPVTATSGGHRASVAFGGIQAGRQALASEGQSVNQDFARNLFTSEALLADHYRQRTLGVKPGQSPTSHFYGGHAQTGLFAGIGGATHTEVVANVEARLKSLMASGQLAPLTDVGRGSFNRIFVQHSTGQIVRVGLVTSDELSGSNAMSKLQGDGHGHAAGAQVDLEQSLYAPGTLALGGRQSEGLGVLVMERVPGQALTRIGASLTDTDRAKIAPQLADALVAMHINGRVHADVMERNIMFDPATGRVRLIDLSMSVRSNREVSIQLDLADMANIVQRYGTAGQGTPASHAYLEALRQAKLHYFRAVDRLPGPDRDAPMYRQQPALYEKHVAQFTARCDALKFKAAASHAASPQPQPAPRLDSAP